MPAECPFCNGTATKVIDTELTAQGRRRRYECRYCGPEHRWNKLSADTAPLCNGSKKSPFLQSCPDCKSSNVKLVETRIVASTGRRRRRFACQECPRRWTDHDGDPPSRGGQAHLAYKKPAQLPLTDAQVEEILVQGLLHGVSPTALGRQFERTSTSITSILRGDYHRKIRPDLKRSNDRPIEPGAPLCSECRHWLLSRGGLTDRCGLEIRDAIHHGASFAADCGAFISATDPNTFS